MIRWGWCEVCRDYHQVRVRLAAPTAPSGLSVTPAIGTCEESGADPNWTDYPARQDALEGLAAVSPALAEAVRATTSRWGAHAQ